jgi:rhamnulokinase
MESIMDKRLLAFDLGAESGRAVLGRFDGQRVALEVVHRFANGPVRLLDALHWDVLRLFAEMQTGLQKCVAEHSGIDSLGVDTWGVDFALLGRGDVLLGNPRHYRDPHTETILEEAFARVPRAEVYRHTGLQFLRINTLFQLLALQRARSPLLDVAERLLFMPDLFHFLFTGVKANEATIASTSQMLDPRTTRWASELLKKFGIPAAWLGEVVPAGTVLGRLRSSVASDCGVEGAPVVVAPASHDTASAVAAVPARGDNWAYISSGTWSLMGVELDTPRIDDEALAANFTNEGGFGGTTRFLKNIMGLWLVQECRRSWEKAGRSYTYDELTRLAEAAPALASLVDPDDAGFMLPADMPTALGEFCRRTGQTVPVGPGAVVRCALESLALKYRWVVDRLETLLQKRIEVIHVVGGGSQNALLCQLTADACGRLVLAGPVEATAVGNVLTQAIGLGLVGTLAEGREIVRRSFETVAYEPRDASRWRDAYQRFLELVRC